ncbi:hypothetical protein E2C01_086138 [Portunus trituberculatus]|uniref:Uncharacterized protein n=1 Tax=Portunus trituberculatus TaxID=210409 RepID=A0A5B7IZZ3_PORTR|nr:hypothetical protein [Portunus trituberculatus]
MRPGTEELMPGTACNDDNAEAWLTEIGVSGDPSPPAPTQNHGLKDTASCSHPLYGKTITITNTTTTPQPGLAPCQSPVTRIRHGRLRCLK